MKIKTKDRILQTALHLFNTKGLAKVTLRTIAQEMGISQGNLNYHFKKREELIEGLYYQLVERFDQLFELAETAEFQLSYLLPITQQTMELLYAYRFLMLDFVQVMRAHPEVRQHFQELGQRRTQQFRMALMVLEGQGMIRAEQSR